MRNFFKFSLKFFSMKHKFALMNATRHLEKSCSIQQYLNLKPNKVKLFQMHLVNGINDVAQQYAISETEFYEFCSRYKDLQSAVITEPCGSMENSYLMVNPEGKFQLNNNGTYQTFENLKTTSLSEILSTVPMNNESFNFRYSKENVT